MKIAAICQANRPRIFFVFWMLLGYVVLLYKCMSQNGKRKKNGTKKTFTQMYMSISIRKKMMMMVKKNVFFFEFLWMRKKNNIAAVVSRRWLLILFACRQYHTLLTVMGVSHKKKLEGKKWLNYTSNPFTFFFSRFSSRKKKLNFFFLFLSSRYFLLFFSFFQIRLRFQLSRPRNFPFPVPFFFFVIFR